MEKAGFQNLIDTLSDVAQRDDWATLYNKQLDFFYWKKRKLSKGVRMVKVSHETHLYLAPSGKIEGVLVEYLTGNFIEHNAEYKNMPRMFDKKLGEGEFTISRKSKKTETLLDKFAVSLKADIYRDAIQDKRTIADLNFVITQSLRKTPRGPSS
jgi:hypothetical protein